MHTNVLPSIDRMAQLESDHRIANNLGLLAALLELDGGIVQDAGAADLAEVLYSARRRIYAVANIHRQLYQTDREGQVDIARYLHDLGANLRTVCQDTGRRRSLAIDADTRYLPAEHAIGVGILVAELVGNACKHAYSEDQPGEVRVILKSHPSGWHLTVEDDGAGFASSPERTAARMGAHLIDASAARLGATYAWHDATPGTRFILWKDERTPDAHGFASCGHAILSPDSVGADTGATKPTLKRAARSKEG